MRVGRGDPLVDLVQRRQIVKDPKASSHRGHDEIFVHDFQICDRRDRQVQLKRLPTLAVVERDEHPELGASIKKPGAVGILAHDTDRMVVRNAVISCRDAGPTLTVVLGLVNVGLEITYLITKDRRVGFRRHVRRHLYILNAPVRPDPGRRDVLPVLAVVSREMDRSIVGPNPDDPFFERGFLNLVNDREMLLAGHVDRDGIARNNLGLRCERGEVRRDGLPNAPAVLGHVNVLRRVVHTIRVVRRYMDRRHPLKPILKVSWVVPVDVPEAYVIMLLLTGATIEHPKAAFAIRVDDGRVSRFRHGGTGLAASLRFPKRRMAARHTPRRQARDRNRRVVLLAGIEAVGKLVADIDLIELRGGLVMLARPCLATVERDVGATVIRLDENIRVVRVDPHIVVVAVRRLVTSPRGTRVLGLEIALRHSPKDVRVLRMRFEVAVIKRPVPDGLEVRYLTPTGATIIGAVDAAFFSRRLDEHVDTVGIRGGNRQVRFAAKPIG